MKALLTMSLNENKKTKNVQKCSNRSTVCQLVNHVTKSSVGRHNNAARLDICALKAPSLQAVMRNTSGMSWKLAFVQCFKNSASVRARVSASVMDEVAGVFKPNSPLETYAPPRALNQTLPGLSQPMSSLGLRLCLNMKLDLQDTLSSTDCRRRGY